MKKLYTIILLAVLINSRSAFAQIDTVANLSSADKLYGLGKFWSEASYNFAYFDHAKINWDSTYRAYIPKVLATKNTWEYYLVMSRFCALLKDGHTNIDFPVPLLTHKSRYKWIYIENFDKRFFVTDMPVQYKDQVPLGSEVISVDGVPAKEYAEKEIIPYISSSTEHVLWDNAAAMMFYGTDSAQVWHLKLRTPKGGMISYNYQFHTYGTKWTRRTGNTPYKVLDFKMIDNIGYVKINTFGDDTLTTLFKAILPQLYTCKAVILDIRNNGGGDTGLGVQVLKYFTDQKQLIGSAWRTRDNRSAFRAWGVYSLRDTTKFEHLDQWHKDARLSATGEYWYKGDTMKFANYISAPKILVPLVVLTSSNTASAAEDFLIFLSQLKGRATVIGQRTYGSTGQPLPIVLPGLTGRICTKRDTYPDGRDFVGIGVIPDIEVPRNVNDVLTGTDAVLDRALKEVKKQIK
jgi:carboxyl-terminal processing protease